MSTFDGYFEPYFGKRIRADRFTQQDTATKIQLLSHIHADHTVGLASQNFRGTLYCSAATKDLLLHSASASERVYFQVNQFKSDRYYTFANLRAPVIDPRTGRQMIGRDGKRKCIDVIKPLDLNVRRSFADEYGSELWITPIDANHCPGAVMFLIESPEHAILYTGDVRAEVFLINRIRQNPRLKLFMHEKPDGSSDPPRPKKRKLQPGRRRLDCIYLDTAAAMTSAAVMTKEKAVSEALELFDLFPTNTRFFINCWTTGYEELLRAVAHKYKTRIHFDNYKRDMYDYKSVSDHDFRHSSNPQTHPPLNDIGTPVFTNTRFHACEKKWKCVHTRGDGLGCYVEPIALRIWQTQNAVSLAAERSLQEDGSAPHIVFVNFAEATAHGWKTYRARLEERCREASISETCGKRWPDNFIVPIARHSTLPELRDLVACFRPRTIYPNTVYPEAQGADYLSLPRLFGDLLAEGGRAQLQAEAQAFVSGLDAQPQRRMMGLPYTAPMGYYDDDNMEDILAETIAAQEEAVSRFASISGRMGEEFIQANFDHLDDANDIELLMRVENPPQLNYGKQEETQRTSTLIEEDSQSTTGRSIGCKASRLPPPHTSKPSIEVLVHPPSSPRSILVDKKAPSRNFQHAPLAQASSDFLAGVAFYFAECVREGDKHAHAWRLKIEGAGGIVLQGGHVRQSAETALQMAHYMLCETREGWEYEKAMESSKAIGNLAWLQQMFSDGRLTSPALHLMWHPRPAQMLPEFAQMTICPTGFDESNKKVVAELARALGCQYCPTFSKTKTSVLVFHNLESNKAHYADKWRIPKVNILWLEDCFVSNTVKSLDDAKYQLLLAPYRKVGQIKQEEDVMSSAAENLPPDEDSPPSPVTLRGEQLRRAMSQLPSNILQPQYQSQSQSQSPTHPSRRAVEKRRLEPSVSLSPRNFCQIKQKANSQPIDALPAAIKEVYHGKGLQAESFETVSTSSKDDTQRIRNVKAASARGAGMPRLRSTEEL